MVSADLERRASQFEVEFKNFKEAQDFVGDFRECRSSFGNLWKSQGTGYSFLSEVAEMSACLMDECAQAESMVPPVEGRIQALWNPIAVSKNTVEAGADVVDGEEEVDQPASSFGASMSGYLNFMF